MQLSIDELEESEAARAELEGYVSRFHDADKRAAILGEQLKTVTALEISFGVGTGLGGVIAGLAPFFWAVGAGYGLAALVIGIGLIVGGTMVRVAKR